LASIGNLVGRVFRNSNLQSRKSLLFTCKAIRESSKISARCSLTLLFPGGDDKATCAAKLDKLRPVSLRIRAAWPCPAADAEALAMLAAFAEAIDGERRCMTRHLCLEGLTFCPEMAGAAVSTFPALRQLKLALCQKVGACFDPLRGHNIEGLHDEEGYVAVADIQSVAASLAGMRLCSLTVKALCEGTAAADGEDIHGLPVASALRQAAGIPDGGLAGVHLTHLEFEMSAGNEAAARPLVDMVAAVAEARPTGLKVLVAKRWWPAIRETNDAVVARMGAAISPEMVAGVVAACPDLGVLQLPGLIDVHAALGLCGKSAERMRVLRVEDDAGVAASGNPAGSYASEPLVARLELTRCDLTNVFRHAGKLCAAAAHVVASPSATVEHDLRCGLITIPMLDALESLSSDGRMRLAYPSGGLALLRLACTESGAANWPGDQSAFSMRTASLLRDLGGGVPVGVHTLHLYDLSAPSDAGREPLRGLLCGRDAPLTGVRNIFAHHGHLETEEACEALASVKTLQTIKVLMPVNIPDPYSMIAPCVHRLAKAWPETPAPRPRVTIMIKRDALMGGRTAVTSKALLSTLDKHIKERLVEMNRAHTGGLFVLCGRSN